MIDSSEITNRNFWDFASEHPVALFFFVMAIGWALSNIILATRKEKQMYLQRDPEDPSKFIELIPKTQCSLAKGESGMVIQMGS